jgi:hypothetical protein
MMKAQHKFHAKPTTIDNIKFASKLEARYYQHLLLLQRGGAVVGFMRQVPLHFKSGNKYVMDFLIFNSDGTCVAVDVKGVETKEFKIKRRLIEDEYPWLDFKTVALF